MDSRLIVALVVTVVVVILAILMLSLSSMFGPGPSKGSSVVTFGRLPGSTGYHSPLPSFSSGHFKSHKTGLDAMGSKAKLGVGSSNCPSGCVHVYGSRCQGGCEKPFGGGCCRSQLGDAHICPAGCDYVYDSTCPGGCAKLFGAGGCCGN